FVGLDGHRTRGGRQRVATPSELHAIARESSLRSRRNEGLDDVAGMPASLDGLQKFLVRDHTLEDFFELGARELQATRGDPQDPRLNRTLDQVGFEIAL